MSDLTADVVVIGGGMAGVSIAAALARDCSVVVVEAETQLAFHSTGRSAAMYLPGYGGPLVRAVTAASRGLYDEASAERDLALLRPRSQLLVAIDEASNVALRQQLSELETLERVDEATALELCPALRPDHVAFAGLDTTGMEIDVDGLHQAYLARLRRAGGTVLRQAPVEAVTRRGAGWEVAAGARRIATATVVDAAGAWADRVAALAGVPGIGLVPKRRTAFISPVAEPFPGLADSPMVVDGMERWYFKPEAGGLLVSPADETPVDPHDARPDELETARAIEAVNEVTTFGLRSVSHGWAGLRSFVADRSPVVGARPDHPGFFFFAGQGGYGIQMAPALAEIGASLLLHGSLAPVPAGPDLAGGLVTAAALGPARLDPVPG
jgi:D-arginine dehydrogenase